VRSGIVQFPRAQVIVWKILPAMGKHSASTHAFAPVRQWGGGGAKGKDLDVNCAIENLPRLGSSVRRSRLREKCIRKNKRLNLRQGWIGETGSGTSGRGGWGENNEPGEKNNRQKTTKNQVTPRIDLTKTALLGPLGRNRLGRRWSGTLSSEVKKYS